MPHYLSLSRSESLLSIIIERPIRTLQRAQIRQQEGKKIKLSEIAVNESPASISLTIRRCLYHVEAY